MREWIVGGLWVSVENEWFGWEELVWVIGIVDRRIILIIDLES